ncbi:MAG: hypothetical protein ACI8X5_003821 [Planctomycetota bacterium]|jgi:hypothetical protein
MKAHRFSQVMSLLPLDHLLPGLCPGTPRYALASLKAGFARLPEDKAACAASRLKLDKSTELKSTITPVSEKTGRVSLRSF